MEYRINRKQVRAAALRAAGFGGVLALLACSGGNSTDGGDANPPAGASSYTVVGNKIVTPAHEVTTNTCNGSESQTQVTKVPSDSAVFEVSADSLKIASGTDTAASGAIVHFTSIFARVGSGSGLEGQWRLIEQAYQVISGTLTTVEKTNYESNNSNSRYLLSTFVNSTLEIGSGKITSSIEANTAGLFMESWNGSNPYVYHKADSTRFDMTAKAIDAHTLELKGRKTGETVTLVMTSSSSNFSGDVVYTSDKAGNATYHYNADAKTCPNPAQPDWYLAFQNANLKTGTKS